jgi:hypothetical protein
MIGLIRGQARRAVLTAVSRLPSCQVRFVWRTQGDMPVCANQSAGLNFIVRKPEFMFCASSIHRHINDPDRDSNGNRCALEGRHGSPPVADISRVGLFAIMGEALLIRWTGGDTTWGNSVRASGSGRCTRITTHTRRNAPCHTGSANCLRRLPRRAECILSGRTDFSAGLEPCHCYSSYYQMYCTARVRLTLSCARPKQRGSNRPPDLCHSPVSEV